MDPLDDLEALVGDAADEAEVIRASGPSGHADPFSTEHDEFESDESPANPAKINNRTVVRKKKKKKKKSKRNLSIVEKAPPQVELEEEKQDVLPVLRELPESEIPQTQRGSAEDDIEKMAAELNITPAGVGPAPRTIKSLKREFDDFDLKSSFQKAGGAGLDQGESTNLFKDTLEQPEQRADRTGDSQHNKSLNKSIRRSNQVPPSELERSARRLGIGPDRESQGSD